MIVSWNWLREYVELDMSVDQLEQRLMMAGLNHEGTETVGDDLAIDLEVTSNRPDCLGHIGVAREVAVLWGRELNKPDPRPAASGPAVNSQMRVEITCPELCSRYTARIIRGVKIGPSPDWLVSRLQTVGIGTVNNVVDITNYVLMECGQPLHAFDLAKLSGDKIIVRSAKPKEKFVAIDHNTYELQAEMCVIADAREAVAIAGVMGGSESEVSAETTDLLIESADFTPLATRTTARALKLHSPSSYRFERGVDPAGIDWASRRCCELILKIAGGELDEGVIDAVAGEATAAEPVTLRFSQLPRILGIDVPAEEVESILSALGNEVVTRDTRQICVNPPSWRRDLTREIDLVEEVARIHGYDKIPEDVGVPMVASTKREEDRVLEMVRKVLNATGFHEAMTISTVNEQWAAAFSPWSSEPPLQCGTPVLEREDRLRKSLVPSLLGARRRNEKVANSRIELFEVAKVYLPVSGGLPQEERMLAVVSGEDFFYVKGVLESLLGALNPNVQIRSTKTSHPLLDAQQSAQLMIGDELLGFLGQVSPQGLEQFELRSDCTVAEVKVSTLLTIAELVRKQVALSAFPAVTRDLNLVVDEAVHWSDVERVIYADTGELLESLEFQDTYRDPKRIGQGKKSLLFSFTLRSQTETLTREQADEIRDHLVARLGEAVGGELRA